LMW